MNVMNYALRVYWEECFTQDFPLGAIKRDEILRYELGSHIFILSGVTAKDGDEEGIPNTLIKAQANGEIVKGSTPGGGKMKRGGLR